MFPLARMADRDNVEQVATVADLVIVVCPFTVVCGQGVYDGWRAAFPRSPNLRLFPVTRPAGDNARLWITSRRTVAEGYPSKNVVGTDEARRTHGPCYFFLGMVSVRSQANSK